MTKRLFMRSAFLSLCAVPFLGGCGTGASEGKIPEAKPATKEDAQAAVDAVKQSMGGMKKK